LRKGKTPESAIIGSIGIDLSNPTRYPASIADMAMFTATVLLPTPPLPDMTMIFF